jgi:hypothetical protein
MCRVEVTLDTKLHSIIYVHIVAFWVMTHCYRFVDDRNVSELHTASIFRVKITSKLLMKPARSYWTLVSYQTTRNINLQHLETSNLTIYIGIEALTVVLKKSAIFWAITLCLLPASLWFLA